ncbi:hydratase [Lachnospiraceae bacterium 62-35]
MVKLYDSGVYLLNGTEIVTEKEMKEREAAGTLPAGLAEQGGSYKEAARKGTMAYSILEAHNSSGNMERLKLRFDAMASHDITYVGIVQTARASGMEEFPIPYVLTNCHNTLCAVGGTINEDDHVFGLSACKKYGGIFVPPHIGVIHQYMREMMAGCGKMILGSDSHTRYGALGTMAVGEGGGELVKQLLKDTYDITYPGVIAVYLTGKPEPYVGPQDIALAIIGAVYKNGYVKNKVMEFVGPGVSSMDTDYRNGVDVMTTETTCLTSVWRTDEDTREYLALHGRADDYKEMNPAETAYYDGMVYVDLSTVKPMIALPFHPSNTYEIDELNTNLSDILREVEVNAAKMIDNPKIDFTLTDKIVDGRLHVEQGVIAGCAGGTYSNIMEAAHILKGKSCGSDIFSLSVYPSSQAVFIDLVNKGVIGDLMAAGATVRSAFCGPCFGAGDTPSNKGLSVRHTTRNFPNREGSKPGNGQIASVALMDARSIAATAANGGVLTSAEAIADGYQVPPYRFDRTVYDNRVYRGYGKGDKTKELVYGPNIKDWPAMSPLADHILLKVCSRIMDPVTTTDELIPSGETSSYRSNPLGLAEFTLSRRDPAYVGRTKEVDKLEKARAEGKNPEEICPELTGIFQTIRTISGSENVTAVNTEIGSVIYAVRPGDGSAREQAASCQRVIGGLANIALEYATKRYRSNVMNWGMIPFLMEGEPEFEIGDYIYVPGIRNIIDGDMSHIPAYIIGSQIREISLSIADMTPEEREIVKAGCLINYNRDRMKNR